jgi:hypothetical protein
MENSQTPDLRALFERLENGPLTVWAFLREDSYETLLGDGYYAYVDQLFLTPTEAARAIETTQPKQMIKVHIRRYDLTRGGDGIQITPAPTEQEPTTIDVIAAKLRSP